MPDPSLLLSAWAACWLVCSCAASSGSPPSADGPGAGFGRVDERLAMVAEQIVARGVDDPRVLAALREMPRHLFLPEGMRKLAYRDAAIPIGQDQTISQPYIVAVMTTALELDGSERVLEIGTGSGYQAAILGELVSELYTIEIVEPLALRAVEVLRAIGHTATHTRIGDGYRGWPEAAPFDAIVVTAAPDHVPQPLVDQLAVGGRMVLPVGGASQELRLLRRTPGGLEEERLIDVRFVPMTGEARD